MMCAIASYLDQKDLIDIYIHIYYMVYSFGDMKTKQIWNVAKCVSIIQKLALESY